MKQKQLSNTYYPRIFQEAKIDPSMVYEFGWVVCDDNFKKIE